ncbi:MAG: hypothetical protein QXH91_01335 [Candidatus Bathyarchaeia archaeon]
MRKPIVSSGIVLLVIGIFLFFLSTISEQYHVSVPQKIQLIYDSQGFWVGIGQTEQSSIFTCSSGDDIYIEGRSGSAIGPTTAKGWFEIWEKLSDQVSQRVYRESYSDWIQNAFHWSWTAPKSANYYIQIVNSGSQDIFFYWGGYTIYAERNVLEWQTRNPYVGFCFVGILFLIGGSVLVVLGTIEKK